LEELSVALLERLNHRNRNSEEFLIHYMPTKRNEHERCHPCSLEREGSHFTGIFFAIGQKEPHQLLTPQTSCYLFTQPKGDIGISPSAA